ncbi:MAG TPA: VOC family protein [Solirubrobacteraceae bacterium]
MSTTHAQNSDEDDDRANVARLTSIEGRGRSGLMPELAVEDARAAIDFYKAAFGAVELHRVGGVDGDEAVVCQLAVGGASFWVAEAGPENRTFSPSALGGGTVRMMLIAEDPDTLHAHALAAGASELAPVEDGYGWRVGKVLDPYGHQWEIARPPAAWPPGGAAAGD